MTNVLPDWLIALQQPLPGELPGEHVARVALAFEGCSLIHERDKLNALFLVNEATPQAAANTALASTNCGTSARQFLCIAGCPDNYITRPYETGQAISWLLAAAFHCGAAIDCHTNPNAWKILDAGWLIRYNTPGQNNDHIEMCLSKPDPNTGVAHHIGGGRANNCIGPMETGDIRHSLGRPIAHIIDPNKLGIPTLPALPAPQPDPTPTPQPTPDPTPAPIVSNEGQGSVSVIGQIIQFILGLLQAIFGGKK